MENKKTIIITGGTDGLGKEIMLNLKPDYEVVIVSNKKESIDTMMRIYGVEAYYCDITKPKEVLNTVGNIMNLHKYLYCLINNAGVFTGGELDDTEFMNIYNVINVNVIGTINFTKAVLPVMKKQKSGKIINIGSTNGIEFKEERSVYGASKWAIRGFTGCLRKELQKYNISVLGINPGLMRTDMHKHAGFSRDLSNAMDAKEAAKIIGFALRSEEIILESITFRGMEAEVY